MSLSLVETIDSFQLVDNSNQLIPSNRPAVVEMGHFFQARAAMGQIRLVAGELKDTATDLEFLKFWRESAGDRELAIESFLSAYGSKAVVVEEPEPEPIPAKKSR
ncbi:hypothetical protein [Telmatospirillum sp.]|uniref:hypothetical protein n=1 Tax=Telmatospirillum sp. TaxID=2079197 RepID=UPI002840B5B5|nr:hypothetical protein [Telmatospirillum sp.]MDR3436429.1 hypothetical protein [Telmatospirillum sp.]